ncbi:hypothetical protein DMK83_17785 [Vibrio parahaemolyticus]|nr:hypothetical protein [Vibrio parahaemolyticus]
MILIAFKIIQYELKHWCIMVHWLNKIRFYHRFKRAGRETLYGFPIYISVSNIFIFQHLKITHAIIKQSVKGYGKY